MGGTSEVLRCDRPRRHKIHIKLHDNRFRGSKVVRGKTQTRAHTHTHTHTHAHRNVISKLSFVFLFPNKESILKNKHAYNTGWPLVIITLTVCPCMGLYVRVSLVLVSVDGSSVTPIYLINSTMQNSCWEINSRSDSQEISCALGNWKLHYHVYKSPSLVHILNLMTPVHNFRGISLRRL
jgi:hypothetical protein